MKKTERKKLSIFLLAVSFLFPMAALGAMSENFVIQQDVFGNAGAYSTSGNYTVDDTMGEAIIGNTSGASYAAAQGFWNTTEGVYVTLDCPPSVTMGVITGTGKSNLATNSATCTVATNSNTGYTMSWRASGPNMQNANSDVFSPYTPAAVEVPETWSVSATDSEWGGHLGSASTTVNTSFWGTGDTYATGKWMNIPATDFTIAQRTNATISGDSQILWFGAEVGANKMQPSGMYTTDILVTAIAL